MGQLQELPLESIKKKLQEGEGVDKTILATFKHSVQLEIDRLKAIHLFPVNKSEIVSSTIYLLSYCRIDCHAVFYDNFMT